jgi:hypothetical protein
MAPTRPVPVSQNNKLNRYRFRRISLNCGDHLRNRTVDLLLTIGSQQVSEAAAEALSRPCAGCDRPPRAKASPRWRILPPRLPPASSWSGEPGLERSWPQGEVGGLADSDVTSYRRRSWPAEKQADRPAGWDRLARSETGRAPGGRPDDLPGIGPAEWGRQHVTRPGKTQVTSQDHSRRDPRCRLSVSLAVPRQRTLLWRPFRPLGLTRWPDASTEQPVRVDPSAYEVDEGRALLVHPPPRVGR